MRSVLFGGPAEVLFLESVVLQPLLAGSVLLYCEITNPWKYLAGLATDLHQTTTDTRTNLGMCRVTEWHLRYLLVLLIESMKSWLFSCGICKVSAWKSQAVLMLARGRNGCSPSNQLSKNIYKQGDPLPSVLCSCWLYHISTHCPDNENVESEYIGEIKVSLEKQKYSESCQEKIKDCWGTINDWKASPFDMPISLGRA